MSSRAALVRETSPTGKKMVSIKKALSAVTRKRSSGLVSCSFSSLIPEPMAFIKSKIKEITPTSPVVVRMVKRKDPDSVKRIFQRVVWLREAGLNLVNEERYVSGPVPRSAVRGNFKTSRAIFQLGPRGRNLIGDWVSFGRM